MSAWTEHVARWCECQRCPLGRQRTNIVLARGSVPCDVLFVGEAPGASEDALGRPFVGPAGRLLDQIIERAIPASVTHALTNLVACFPREAKGRGDNEPERSEILACRPRLVEFAAIAAPKLVVLVGVLASDYANHDARGRVFGAHAIDIAHPAHILRMPLTQRDMAARKCVVQIQTALEGVIQWRSNDDAIKADE